jgi:cytochrome c oxidase subunit 4
MPLSWLLGTWAALMALTVLTVAVSHVDLGGLNVWLAVGIATFKAVLVILFFMHMLHERFMNVFILCAALVFVFVFIGLVLMDTTAYQPSLIRDYAPSMQR